MTRRGFLDYLTGGVMLASLGGIVGSILAYLWPESHAAQGGGVEKVEVGDAMDLPEGRGRAFPFKNRSALVIHTSSGFVALSAICTHQECVVRWDETQQKILCPCHGATFDVRGNVLSGPPPRPLAGLRVAVVDGKIYLWEGA